MTSTRLSVASDRRMGAILPELGTSLSPPGAASCHQLIDKMIDGVIVISRAGVIRYVNPAAQKLLGKSADQLIGAPFGTPILPCDRTEIDLFHDRVRPFRESEAKGRVAEMG